MATQIHLDLVKVSWLSLFFFLIQMSLQLNWFLESYSTAQVSCQVRLVSCATRIAWRENHWSGNFWHKLLTSRPARNQPKISLSVTSEVPQELRKTGVRFGAKFLSRSFILACDRLCLRLTFDTALDHDVSFTKTSLPL